VRYSDFDRELWSCVAGIRHFRHMREGRQFTVYTAHKPLTQAIHHSSDPWIARQCRHLSYVAEFTSDVRHVAGAENMSHTCCQGRHPANRAARGSASSSKLIYASLAKHCRSTVQRWQPQHVPLRYACGTSKWTA
jgi:hypothetical protein